MITNQRATRADRSDLAMSLRLYLDADAAYNWALVNCVSSGSDLGEIEASRIVTELRALRDARYDLHRRRLARVNRLLSAAVDSGST